MQGINIMDGFYQTRRAFFHWRTQAAVFQKLALTFGMTCVTGLLAQLKITLPWTPVPIVASTLGVVLAGTLLGRWWGGLSMFIYIIGGMAGIPWFAGGSGGVGVFLGATGGYLIGFILAALFIGQIVDSNVKSRRLLPMLGIMSFTHLIIIYLPGLTFLYLWLTFVKSQTVTLMNLFWMGAIPFIIGDLIKSAISALIITVITPKEDYK
jgi:biotin transport system substrate-specific component